MSCRVQISRERQLERGPEYPNSSSREPTLSLPARGDPARDGSTPSQPTPGTKFHPRPHAPCPSSKGAPVPDAIPALLFLLQGHQGQPSHPLCLSSEPMTLGQVNHRHRDTAISAHSTPTSIDCYKGGWIQLGWIQDNKTIKSDLPDKPREKQEVGVHSHRGLHIFYSASLRL